MSEDRLDSLLREAAASYHRPPVPPREAMWEAIQAERHQRRRRSRIAPAAWRTGLGMAAMLAIGIGLGRLTMPVNDVAPADSEIETASPSAPGRGATVLPYRVAATHHLARTEAFLTSFRNEPHGVRTTPELIAWARELLTGTRLLLDSPAADDPHIRFLLQDLEFVLAQIAHLPASADTGTEAEWIDQALEQRGTLTRLRATVPAGPAIIGT